MTTRILLADDHRIMRQGLRSLVENEMDMEVVAEAQDGRGAVKLAKKFKPDVVIMDVAMPDLNGVEATRRIRKENPNVRVIALSVHADRHYVGHMLEAGAAGYLLKDCAFEELETAIRTVVANRTYLSPTIAEVVVDGYVRRARGGKEPVAPPLTPREREVLQLMAEGSSTKEIASHLKISVKTVETHRRNTMRKLGVRSVAELTKYAIREGLTSLEP